MITATKSGQPHDQDSSLPLASVAMANGRLCSFNVDSPTAFPHTWCLRHVALSGFPLRHTTP